MESSFQVAVCECPDINATTMAVDATGRFVIVGGRKSMGLIDLSGDQQDQSVDAAGRTYNNPLDTNATDASASLEQQGQITTASMSGSPKIVPVCKRIVRNSKYEPTASQFAKYLTDLYAITTYQTVEVFSIEDLNPNKPKLTLRGHSRAIADIEWSHFEPHLIGSSAADCLTNLWDIRDSRRPSACLTSVHGATQIRFSKTSSNLVATSHEIDVRLWDIRQPNLPLHYIAAHLQKINGMDWNPNKNCDHEQLITCSQDNTIKIWDLTSNKIKPSACLQTRTPSWRIRYTPVSSYALLTSTLPQLRSRTECMTLKLWSMKPNRFEQKKLELILGLVGHSDVIVDFDWRHSQASAGSCEIISWSKDHTLRIWRVDNQFIEMNVEHSDFETECEYQENSCDTSASMPDNSSGNTSALGLQSRQKSSPLLDSNQVEKTEVAKSFLTDDTNSPNKSQISKQFSEESNCDDLNQDDEENLFASSELKQEFNLINKSIPNIEFEELNSLRRVCLVSARAKSIICRLRIALPPNYPHNECPTFTIIDSNQFGGECLSKEAKEKLLNLLNETAKSHLARSRKCLEPCLRKFITALQRISSNYSLYKKHTLGLGNEYKDDPITLSAQRDHSIPFPATSGARFCGNLLICFGRPMMTSGGADSLNWLVDTPRSMAQLSAQLDNMRRQGSYNLSNISISYFYYGAMRRAELQNRASNKGDLNLNSRASNKYLPGRSKSSPSVQPLMSKNYKCGPVLVYNVSEIFGGISRELAESYVFDKDVIKMCRRNAELAAVYNRRDLVQIWSLAELSSEGVLRSYLPNKDDPSDKSALSFIHSDSDFGDRPWTMHPFGSKLIQSLIDHYVFNCHDVQTAAMLIWTFSSPRLGKSVRLQGTKHSSQSTNAIGSNSNNCSNLATQNLNTRLSSFYNLVSNYQTVLPGMLNNLASKQPSILSNDSDKMLDDWNLVNEPDTHLYSNSWSNSTTNEHLVDQNNYGHEESIITDDYKSELGNRFPKLNILSVEKSLQNDLIMHIYAELLYRLNLLNQRAMLLKNIGSNSCYSEIFGDKQAVLSICEPPKERLPNLVVRCSNATCSNHCRSAQCDACKKYSLFCSICRLPVKGSCSICSKCFHGGHVNHFSAWFSANDLCPTGCGCECLSSESC